MAATLAGCGKRAEALKQTPPPVTVSRPSQERLTDCVEMTGTLASSKSVDLVARVTGYLRSAEFEDGSFVEAGQLLFLIEPETYEQELALAKAALIRADAEYSRQVGLIQSNATSVANVERWLSERDQAAAQVELAKLNLGYTRVTAPFSGRIGRRLVDPGNLVGPAANTKLATLDQLVPIYVYVNLNELEALRLWEIVRQRGPDLQVSRRKTIVEIGLQNEEGYPHAGTLDFVSTGVSTSSGTIPMRAVLKNEDKVLFPGLFARVRIPFGEPQPMLVVPNSALGTDQEGDYARPERPVRRVRPPGHRRCRRRALRAPRARPRSSLRLLELALEPDDLGAGEACVVELLELEPLAGHQLAGAEPDRAIGVDRHLDED